MIIDKPRGKCPRCHLGNMYRLYKHVKDAKTKKQAYKPRYEECNNCGYLRRLSTAHVKDPSKDYLNVMKMGEDLDDFVHSKGRVNRMKKELKKRGIDADELDELFTSQHPRKR